METGDEMSLVDVTLSKAIFPRLRKAQDNWIEEGMTGHQFEKRLRNVLN